MNRPVEAIYENGVLGPLEPLALDEHQLVTVLVGESAGVPGRAYQDIRFADEFKKGQQANSAVPSIEEILELVGTDTSSWSNAIVQEREERF